MDKPESDPLSAPCSRRRLMRLAARLGGAVALGRAGLAAATTAPPRETGLSFEGLLKREPGFQPRRPAPMPYASLPGFLSARQIAQAYSAYRRAFADLIEAERRLASAARDAAHAAQYAALRARQMRAANAVLLHEFFFRNLAPEPVAPSPYVMANLHEHMGSFASWREDFAACARVAGAWAVLAYDPYDDRWHNTPLGADDAGGWTGANPLVVIAVAAETWSLDYPDRDRWTAAAIEHIDWNAVAARYHAVDRQ